MQANQVARSLMPNVISIGPKRMWKHGEKQKRRLIKLRLRNCIHGEVSIITTWISLREVCYFSPRRCDGDLYLGQMHFWPNHLPRASGERLGVVGGVQSNEAGVSDVVFDEMHAIEFTAWHAWFVVCGLTTPTLLVHT